jgi:hypothetical protein
LNGSALVYTLIAASANVIGAAAVVSRSRWSVRALDTMVALSAGFMISVALLDLAPEAIATHGESAALVILLGYLLVHLTQHTLAPHFHFGEEVHHVSKVTSFSALAGLMLHTFVDGVAIASGFGVSHALGVLVFLAILLHKLLESFPRVGRKSTRCSGCQCCACDFESRWSAAHAAGPMARTVRIAFGGGRDALRRGVQSRARVSGEDGVETADQFFCWVRVVLSGKKIHRSYLSWR